MTEQSDKGKKHWLRPLKGKWRSGQHLLLWPEEKVKGRRVEATAVRGTTVWLDANGEMHEEDTSVMDEVSLDDVIAQAFRAKGTLTIWIPGGWDHLVLSGLAELIDQGAITWRYCALESHRVLIRGLWRGRSIIITSLGNWTGGTWDQWRSNTASRGMELFKESFHIIVYLSQVLRLGSVAPSAGAAGLLLWRSWLAPRLSLLQESPGNIAPGMKGKRVEYVAPLPSRPNRCRHSERHTAYGLVHRQMRRGLVAGPIYCVDMREAYLVGLMSCVVPLIYSKGLHQPKIEELAEMLAGHVGCALVQVRSPEVPYPARRNGRVLWATGQYWTWLAGIELARAICSGHVLECKSAYIWSGGRYPDREIQDVLSFGESLHTQASPLANCAWRSVYSQLVGRFAAWRRRWLDAPAQHNFGRWAYWHGLDPETGQPQAWRSVAGRTQRLKSREDAGDSVALLFASVTAQCRFLLSRLADIAQHGNVLAIEADALWLTPAGWQSLQRRCSELSLPPDNLCCKETFERAWMTGSSIAVVEMNGKQYLRCPGVPADIAVGQAGDVRWPQADDWHRDNGPDPKRGVRRLERRYSAKEITKVYNDPAVELPYSDELIDPMLPEQLLQPLEGPERNAPHV